MAARYCCYQCSRMVNPILEAKIKCPYCKSDLIEKIISTVRDSQDTRLDRETVSTIYMRRRRGEAAAILRLLRDAAAGTADTAGDRDGDRDRLRERGIDPTISPGGQVMKGESSHDNAKEGESSHGADTRLDRETESTIHRRRRRRSRRSRETAAILQLLRDAEAGTADTAGDRDGDRDRLRERGIDPTISPGGQVMKGESSHGADTRLDRETESTIHRRRRRRRTREAAAILQLLRDAAAGSADTAGDRDGDRDRLRERGIDPTISPGGQVMKGESSHGADTRLDRETESTIHRRGRRRRREAAAILRSLQDAAAGTADTARDRDGDRDRLRERERVTHKDPSDQTIALGGRMFNLHRLVVHYFVSPFDLLLRAEKCSICLKQLHNGKEIGRVACKHWFHSDCISTGLEHSSSCPLCRSQLRIDVLRTNADGSGNGNEIVMWNMMWDAEGSGEEGEGWFSLNSGSHSRGGNSTSSPSGSSSNGREDASS